MGIFSFNWLVASFVDLAADLLSQMLCSLQLIHDDESDRTHIILIKRKDWELGQYFLFELVLRLLKCLVVSLVFKEARKYPTTIFCLNSLFKCLLISLPSYGNWILIR